MVRCESVVDEEKKGMGVGGGVGQARRWRSATNV